MERGHEIKILDHGYVKLIDYMGSDEAIVEAARMSTGRGFVSWEAYRRCKRCDILKGESLIDSDIGYCAGFGVDVTHDWQEFPRGDLGLLETMYKNKHSTPFEFGTLHIEVQAPLMVFREWHRHRTWGYSEFSARYSQMPDLHYVPDESRVQLQSKSNKQGSSHEVHDDAARFLNDITKQQSDVYRSYDAWVGQGVAKEVARLNTPVSRYSKMRGIVNLRNALAFLLLRKAPAAQFEIRQYADAVGEMVKAIWPRTYDLFVEHDLNGAHLSRSEITLLRKVMKIGEFAHRGYVLTDDESKLMGAIEKKLGA
jgi:thymidylate synthase (FAD)